jgi:hypothetical protein
VPCTASCNDNEVPYSADIILTRHDFYAIALASRKKKTVSAFGTVFFFAGKTDRFRPGFIPGLFPDLQIARIDRTFPGSWEFDRQFP